VRVRLPLVLIAATLWAAPAALADSSSSSNWAGYAIHRSGVKFKQVLGAWTQPSLTCVPGYSSFSAYWIGLGGYGVTSNALEQVGTEADCGTSGQPQMSAWYELVPAPSRGLKLAVRAGDTMAATVTVTGHKVVILLKDQTRHKSVTKTLHASSIDVSSAEWIAEAPSECGNANSCQTLPLADFGSTNFAFAYADTIAGRAGAIANKGWDTTRITLVSGGRRFVGHHNGAGGDGEATPSKLTGKGSAFTVTYSSQPHEGGNTSLARDFRAGHIVHPAR
jgi:hypothetical protein